jgi:hypothetical protein
MKQTKSRRLSRLANQGALLDERLLNNNGKRVVGATAEQQPFQLSLAESKDVGVSLLVDHQLYEEVVKDNNSTRAELLKAKAKMRKFRYKQTQLQAKLLVSANVR